MSTLRDIVGSDEPTTVENMLADRPLVDLLYARGVIDKKAKQRAFNALYPRTATRKLVLNSILAVAAVFFAFGFLLSCAFSNVLSSYLKYKILHRSPENHTRTVFRQYELVYG